MQASSLAIVKQVARLIGMAGVTEHSFPRTRVAMTGGAVALYLNREVSDTETDGQEQPTSDETQQEVDGDKGDDQTSDIEGKPDQPQPSKTADSDQHGWLQERLDGIREWLPGLGRSVESSQPSN